MPTGRELCAAAILIAANVLAGIYDGDLLKLTIGADVAIAALLLELKPPKVSA